MPVEEEDIFRCWNLDLAFQQAHKNPTRKTENTNQAWQPPVKGAIKLNFDDASKDNPGKSRAGGLLRDLEGRILAMFTSNMGYNSNNVAELEGLIRGLDMAKHQGIMSLLEEGDSLLIITTLKRLREGANPKKISTNWRLSHGWTQVSSIIQHF